MKKLLAFLLVTIMACSLAACGSEDASAEIKDANEVIVKVSEAYNESAQDELPVVTEESIGEDFSVKFCVPEEALAMVDDGSGMMHAMMANNFTASAVHVEDKGNVKEVVSAIKTQAKDTEWLCGVPETLLIYTVGEEYVLTVFGAGDILAGYEEAVTAVYGDAAELSSEESLW